LATKDWLSIASTKFTYRPLVILFLTCAGISACGSHEDPRIDAAVQAYFNPIEAAQRLRNNNSALAKKLLRRAEREGDTKASFALAALSKDNTEKSEKSRLRETAYRLENAAKRGDMKAIKKLIEHYGKHGPAGKKIHWLHRAAEWGDSQAKALVRNIKINRSIAYAIEENRVENFYRELKKSSDLNLSIAGEGTLLTHAIQARRSGMVNALLKHGAKPGYDDYFKRYHLELAAATDPAMVFYLLNAGADINVPSRKKIVAYLLEDCPTAFYRRNKAAYYEYLDLVLLHKPSLDSIDENKDSALNLAIECRDAVVFKKLLDAGASMDVKNRHGTIIEHARESKVPEIIDIISNRLGQ